MPEMIKNKWGRWVSKARHDAGVRNWNADRAAAFARGRKLPKAPWGSKRPKIIKNRHGHYVSARRSAASKALYDRSPQIRQSFAENRRVGGHGHGPIHRFLGRAFSPCGKSKSGKQMVRSRVTGYCHVPHKTKGSRRKPCRKPATRRIIVDKLGRERSICSGRAKKPKGPKAKSKRKLSAWNLAIKAAFAQGAKTMKEAAAMAKRNMGLSDNGPARPIPARVPASARPAPRRRRRRPKPPVAKPVRLPSPVQEEEESASDSDSAQYVAPLPPSRPVQPSRPLVQRRRPSRRPAAVSVATGQLRRSGRARKPVRRLIDEI